LAPGPIGRWQTQAATRSGVGRGAGSSAPARWAGAVPAIPIFLATCVKGVDGRAKPGHDGKPEGGRRVTISGRWY